MRYVVEVERVERVVHQEIISIEADSASDAQKAIQDHWVSADVTDHLPEREQEYGFKVIEWCTTEEFVDTDSTTEEICFVGVADKQ